MGHRDPRVDDYLAPLPAWQREKFLEVRDLLHEADPEIDETIKRSVQPYFVLNGNVAAFLAAKDHVTVFLYDPLIDDPDGIITAGHGNSTGRQISLRRRGGGATSRARWRCSARSSRTTAPAAGASSPGLRLVISLVTEHSRTILRWQASTAGSPILVVDDDAKIVRLVRTYLEREGYPVVTAGDGVSALAAIARHRPRLAVLDLMLPGTGRPGRDPGTARRRRRDADPGPVREGTLADRIRGFEDGADDYLPKPFSPAELRPARQVACCAGPRRRSGDPIVHGDLLVDPARYEVRRSGSPSS